MPFRDLAAEVEHHQPVDHGQQRVHDVLDPHDGGAAGADALDGGDQLVAFALGQPAGDLVEQQQLRPGGEARAISSRLRSSSVSDPAAHWRAA